MVRMKCTVKMMYKGETQTGNSKFNCDDEDVADLECMGLARRLTKEEQAEEEQESGHTPAPRRGRYNRTDMRAED